MSSLEVSELLPCTCASLSPDGRLLAYGADAELVVRGVAELEAVASWPCPTLSALSWSPDGRLLLASPRKASFVLLFDPGSSGWRGRVDEAGGGLACARWAPCSRAVLTAASFGLTLTAWSLRDGAAATALPRPKWPARGLGFTPDGALACLLLRGAAGRDAVAVLACGAGWAAACRFEAASADATDLAVCSAAVCLVDAPQAGGGAALHALDGALLGRFAADASGLGLRCVAWSPDGRSLAGGGWGRSAWLVGRTSWRPAAELPHGPALRGPPSCAAYREADSGPGGGGGRAARYVLQRPPMHLPPAPPPPPKAGADAGGAPGGGVAGVAWSPCGRLVATRCDSCPQGCWVWDAERALLIALLLHRDPVRDWAWEPAPAVGGEGGGRLALCTGTGTLFLWGPEGASCVALPAAAPAGPGLRLTALHWGAQLAAVSDAGVCIVYTGGA